MFLTNTIHFFLPDGGEIIGMNHKRVHFRFMELLKGFPGLILIGVQHKNRIIYRTLERYQI